jgi:chemotaxis protein MotB
VSPGVREHYATNWELSTARATNVVRFLEEKCGIPGRRLVAAGYAQHRPVADNATEDGKRRNRRIEIALLQEMMVVE